MRVSAPRSVRARIGGLMSIVPVVAGVVLAGSALTGCDPPPHAVPVITGVNFPSGFFVTPDNTKIWYSERFTGESGAIARDHLLLLEPHPPP